MKVIFFVVVVVMSVYDLYTSSVKLYFFDFFNGRFNDFSNAFFVVVVVYQPFHHNSCTLYTSSVDNDVSSKATRAQLLVR
jgi:hypothetical protein